MNRRFKIVSLTLLVLASACGKRDFNGVYTGSATVTQNGTASSPQNMSLSLSQNDKAITGSSSSTPPANPNGGTTTTNMIGASLTGTVTGTAENETISPFNVTVSTAGCSGTYTGSVTMSDKSGNNIAVNVSGRSNCGDLSATATLSRQSSSN